ncbi:MAG: aldo/keto reductase [Geodermatophilaceae bacterium]|jgi:diketogulonate reductase-like aldo/keto reductase|nr:aldo/keto reductase [Geodermatophilaceae bacterium]
MNKHGGDRPAKKLGQVSQPSITLNDGTAIPQVGFGVFKVPPEDTQKVVLGALEAGYRHIDTAQMYRNEAGVGAAIRASGIPRDEIYVTTKLNNDMHGYDTALWALDGSLQRLKLSFVDLFLIHWPMPAKQDYVETWTALESLKADGGATSIGVSNFQPAHLNRLLAETGTVPAVNQIELHPNFPQHELRTLHAEHNIATEAWSPLARGALLDDQSVVGLAEKYGKTPAQAILRWHIQLGNIVIPKSVTPERIASNIQVFDFELTDQEMASINGLETGVRIGPHPNDMN